VSQTNQTSATFSEENTTSRVIVPALVAHGYPLRPVRAGETAAGHALFAARSEAEARAFMATYPQAAMPCWKRPDFFSAQVRA
jgi:hypothetical protein